MQLEKQRLPCDVTIAGQLYRVKTDFRFGLMFTRFVRENKPLKAFEVFFEGSLPPLTQECADALVAFYAPPVVLPRSITMLENSRPVLDYELDGDLIFAAFMQCYGIDLFEVRLHWHKFLALVHGLKDTKLNEVIQIRGWSPRGNIPYDVQMAHLKAAWEIPTQEVAESDPALEAFLKPLKKGKGGKNGRRQNRDRHKH